MLKEYVGKYVTLQVVKQAPQGLYLGLDLESKDTILLPKAYTKGENIGDKIEVFIYTDSEDRLVATSSKPLVTLNQIALLKIKGENKDGLFLDIGLPKDVFMPLKSKLKNVTENKELIKAIASGESIDKALWKASPRYKIGEKIAAKITLDKQNRLIAKNDISRYLKKCDDTSIVHKRFKAIIYAESKLGLSCAILPFQYSGLIYHKEHTKNLKINMETFVKVLKIRDDGNVDIMPERNRNALLDMIKSLNKKGEYFIANDENALKLEMSKNGLEKELKILMQSKKIHYIDKKGYEIPNPPKPKNTQVKNFKSKD